MHDARRGARDAEPALHEQDRPEQRVGVPDGGEPQAEPLLAIDPEGRRVFLRGEEVQLTGKEFELLRVLVANEGKVVSREKLMRDVWDSAWYGSTKTLDMHISVLRRKLGDDAASPRYITTIRGLGFRFDSPED